MIIVTIQKCDGSCAAYTHHARTDDVDTAIDRAIRKMYHGGGALFFSRDNGISVGPDALAGTQYGQIMRRLSARDGGGASAVTGRISIRAVKVGEGD